MIISFKSIKFEKSMQHFATTAAIAAVAAANADYTTFVRFATDVLSVTEKTYEA